MISTKGRYALRVMIDLAEHHAETANTGVPDRSNPSAASAFSAAAACDAVPLCRKSNASNAGVSETFIPLKDIAERQQISKKYLEIIVKDLVRGGLVKGASGKGGGYLLCRKPEDYSVGEILEITEGPLAPVACLAKEAEACPRASACQTLPMWEEFDQMIHDFFYGKKLTDLMSGH